MAYTTSLQCPSVCVHVWGYGYAGLYVCVCVCVCVCVLCVYVCGVCVHESVGVYACYECMWSVCVCVCVCVSVSEFHKSQAETWHTC